MWRVKSSQNYLTRWPFSNVLKYPIEFLIKVGHSDSGARTAI